MFLSDGKGSFLSLSHLHFDHQSNLHFYGIINKEESHLHFILTSTTISGGGGIRGEQWSGLENRSVIGWSLFFRRDGMFEGVGTKICGSQTERRGRVV